MSQLLDIDTAGDAISHAFDPLPCVVEELDPDVLTGWNVVDFDLSVLQRIAARLHHAFDLGRDSGALRVRKAEGYFGSGHAAIPGRLVLDGIDLLRGAFVRMDDYSLDAVAREVLGEGKALAGEVGQRIGEIERNYRHDLAAFARYACEAYEYHNVRSALAGQQQAVLRSRSTRTPKVCSAGYIAQQ